MEIRHLTNSDYKITPWKNGRGTTTQIMIHPRDASLQEDNFIWRLSSAKIDEDGPFSLFPNCTRHLAILSGKGVTLETPQGAKRLALYDSFQFSGAEIIFCRLQDKTPVADLNLIVKKDSIEGLIEVLTSEKAQILQEGSYLVFNFQGSLTLKLDQTLHLKESEALFVHLAKDDTARLHIKPDADGSYAWIQIKNISR